MEAPGRGKKKKEGSRRRSKKEKKPSRTVARTKKKNTKRTGGRRAYHAEKEREGGKEKGGGERESRMFLILIRKRGLKEAGRHQYHLIKQGRVQIKRCLSTPTEQTGKKKGEKKERLCDRPYRRTEKEGRKKKRNLDKATANRFGTIDISSSNRPRGTARRRKRGGGRYDVPFRLQSNPIKKKGLSTAWALIRRSSSNERAEALRNAGKGGYVLLISMGGGKKRGRMTMHPFFNLIIEISRTIGKREEKRGKKGVFLIRGGRGGGEGTRTSRYSLFFMTHEPRVECRGVPMTNEEGRDRGGRRKREGTPFFHFLRPGRA